MLGKAQRRQTGRGLGPRYLEYSQARNQRSAGKGSAGGARGKLEGGWDKGGGEGCRRGPRGGGKVRGQVGQVEHGQGC